MMIGVRLLVVAGLASQRTLADCAQGGCDAHAFLQVGGESQRRLVGSHSRDPPDYWKSVADDPVWGNFNALDKVISDNMKEKYGLESYDSLAGSKIGVGISTVANLVSAALSSDWESAAKTVASGLDALISLGNPLVGLVGGVVLSLWRPGPTHPTPWQKARDYLLDQMQKMITLNNVKQMEKASTAKFNNLIDQFHDDFTDDMLNESEAVQLGKLNGFIHGVVQTTDDLYSLACTNGDSFENTPGLSGLNNSEECNLFLASGVYMKQLTIAQLHMFAMTQVARFPSEKSVVHNLLDWSQAYLRKLRESLWAWKHYAPLHVTCQFKGGVEFDANPVIGSWTMPNTSWNFTQTGENIADTMECASSATATWDCEDPYVGPESQQCDLSIDPKDPPKDLCGSDVSASQSQCTGAVEGGGCKLQTGSGPGYGKNLCTHEKFYKFKSTYAGRLSWKFDKDLDVLEATINKLKAMTNKVI